MAFMPVYSAITMSYLLTQGLVYVVVRKIRDCWTITASCVRHSSQRFLTDGRYLPPCRPEFVGRWRG